MDPSHIRWLFFDIGGTLVNEDAAIAARTRQMVEACHDLGLDIAAEAVSHALDEASAQFAPSPFSRMLEMFEIGPAEQAVIRERCRWPRATETPYPEAREVLAELARTHAIGVIANQSAGAHRRLESYGLAHFVSVCVSSAEAGVAKPDPRIFRLALEHARCEPHQAVMIGDRLDNDIRPANRLGWATIRTLRGQGQPQQPREAADRPDFTVRDLREIPPLLRG